MKHGAADMFTERAIAYAVTSDQCWRMRQSLGTLNRYRCLAIRKGYGAGVGQKTARFGFEPTGNIPNSSRELLLSQCGAGGQVDPRKLGQWLKRISGRLYDGYRIVPGRADKHDKVQRWMLTITHDA